MNALQEEIRAAVDQAVQPLVAKINALEDKLGRKQERLLDIHQAAAILGKNVRTLRRWVREGSIKSQRIGASLYFRKSDLE